VCPAPTVTSSSDDARGRRLLSIASGKGYALLRAFERHGWLWRTAAAAAAGISGSAADETLVEMEQFRLVQRRRAGRRVEWNLAPRGVQVLDLIRKTDRASRRSRLLHPPADLEPDSDTDVYCVVVGGADFAGADLMLDLAARARQRGASATLVGQLADPKS
jgi:hypothetical protein